MTNMQKSSMKKIFAGKLQIPDLEAGNDQENDRKIEKFAKDILQLELY